MNEKFSDYKIEIPYGRRTGNVKCYCPKCHDQRTNKRDKSLSVNIDKGVWHCHYCEWSGGLKTDNPYTFTPKPQYRRPTPKAQQSPFSSKFVQWFAKRGISEKTLIDIRIVEGKEFMPQVGKEMNTIQFCYYLDGELVNVKYRDGAKHFKLEQGAELIPYNIDAIADTPECIITEGEIDCLSFHEIGRTDVISVPNGANSNLSYLDEFIEGWLDDKKTIYIASDSDSKGLILQEELVRRLGKERCKIVSYGDDCKDANEVLMKHGKEALMRCLIEAKDIPVDGIYTLPDYVDSLDALYQTGLQAGLTIGHENFDKAISFETKRLCVVTGIPSSGKSEFIDEICVRLNIRYDFRVAYFSPENMPLAYHASKLIEKLVGKRLRANDMNEMEYERAKLYYTENFFHILPNEGYMIDNILEKAKYLVVKRGIKILVIDPYNRLESQQGSKSETQYISEVLDKLTNFAQQNDVLVILMAHPRKILKETSTDGVPTLYDINGSANFYNKADFGIIVHRHKNDNDHTLVRVQKVKFKHLGTGGDVTFKYDIQNGRYAPWNAEENSLPIWEKRNFISMKDSNTISQLSIIENMKYDLNGNDDFLVERDEIPF